MSFALVRLNAAGSRARLAALLFAQVAIDIHVISTWELIPGVT